MASKIMVLNCITNMHVGNGDVNYNIIDNEVEKDPITGYPTVNASGVKGALREYFEKGPGQSAYGSNVNNWFGSDKDKTQGNVKVLAAEMVFMPLRASEGDSAYYCVTTNSTVERINDLGKTFIGRGLFDGKKEDETINKKAEGIALKYKTEFGKDKVSCFVVSDKDMRNVDLPVVARNKLENGISKNLWYEEIVPHGSTFIVPVVCEDEEMLNKFVQAVNDQIIQFGGNASIGYGLCKITVEEKNG